MYACIGLSLRITVVNNTAQNSYDNFHSYRSPDNHHSSDNVYWRGGGGNVSRKCRQSHISTPAVLVPHFPFPHFESNWLMPHYKCNTLSRQSTRETKIILFFVTVASKVFIVETVSRPIRILHLGQRLFRQEALLPERDRATP